MMQIDCLVSMPKQPVPADICIVGAGVAGTVIAEQLANTRLKVCVIETGGFQYDESSHQMSDMALSTELWSKVDRYEFHSQRMLGGSGNVWQGLCRELDEEDFKQRDYIPLSGWPMTKKDLAPWYQKSSELLNFSAEPEFQDSMLSDTKILQSRFQISPERFVNRWQSGVLQQADNVALYFNATVTELKPVAHGGAVKEVIAKNLKGEQFVVTADKVVIAAGGLSSPQLLLQNREKFPLCKAYQNKWIGTCFMEHPHLENIFMTWLPDQLNIDTAWTDGRFSCFYLDEKLRGQHRLMNASYTLSSARDHQIDIMGLLERLSGRVDKRVLQDVQAMTGALFNEAGSWYVGYLRSEQAPDPANRVALIDEKNVIGEKKISLNYNIKDIDFMCIEKNTELLFRELLKLHPAVQVKQFLAHNDRYKRSIAGGGHFMGTLRMSDNANTGCVDGDGLLYGLSNLYIAGSSIFTTGGFSNPTQTIVALSMRLADKLKEV